ncbi:hypothetical protein K443DRAFT_2239 [Laccaria amethystina LaAM-08-1]|uniref:Uncharacterized protein n=1 Tax=Laccaria amethystina LaAM-08-1 TaxID=1095629 RepID=A0A0C9YBP1_9AGAR|nr:hypothetical protein K443DRAFT_2239 [Laccaria amethystina LaAM-08-1]
MYAPIFNTESFVAATLFIERLLQNEDHVFNIIDQCQNDPTLSLDLQLILEATATEKHLEDKLGYKDRNVLSLHTIVTTAIAAAIRHGILNTIRDSKKLPVVPNYIPITGRNSLHLLESPLIIIIDVLQLLVARNAKSLVTFTKTAVIINVKDAFGGDQDIPPLIAKQKIAVGENQSTPIPNIDHGDIIQKQGNNDGRPSTNGQGPKKQPEVIDLTSPSPPPSLLPPTPPPSLWTPPSSPLYHPWSPSQLTPLLNLTDLISDFDSVASSNSSVSDLGNVGDIEV